jgi:hypothetical protein
MSSNGHTTESVLASNNLIFVLTSFSLFLPRKYVSLCGHAIMSISRISAGNVCLVVHPELLSATFCCHRISLVFFAGFILVEKGGRQFRRFIIVYVTQQHLDVRPVSVRIYRTRNQGAIQRHIHLGKQAMKEIIRRV